MIIVCEPQCIGFQHAEVNAAFMVLLSMAFPGEKFILLAEKSHGALVRERLSRHAQGVLSTFEFQDISVPGQRGPSLLRIPAEYLLCRRVFDTAERYHTERIILCSITSPGLFMVKHVMRRHRKARCAIVLHGIIHEAVNPPWHRPLDMLVWFRYPLLMGSIPRITYIVNAPSIVEQMRVLIPELKDRVDYINLPYFFETAGHVTPFRDGRVRFAHLGGFGGQKRSELFCRLAAELRGQGGKLRPAFVFIGHIPDRRIRETIGDYVELPSPERPMDRDMYERLVKGIDYAVFMYNPATFRMQVSGAAFDAFSFVRPMIAIRNPFFEYCFREMGDIGYLCDSYDEVANVVRHIVENRPIERYRKQCANIVSGRRRLDMAESARSIRGMWEY